MGTGTRTGLWRWVATGLLLGSALSLCAKNTLAHEKRGARKAMVSAKWDSEHPRLEVMLFLRVGGPRAQNWIARYDVNGSRVLEAVESQLLGDALGRHALGGLQLRQADKPIAPTDAQAKARIVDGDAVEVAVLMTYPMRSNQPLEFEIRDVDTRGKSPHGALLAEFAALAPLVIESATVPPKMAVVGPFVLRPGKAGLKVALTRQNLSP